MDSVEMTAEALNDATVPKIVFAFRDADDNQTAQRETITLTDILTNLGIPEDHVRIAYDRAEGFTVEVAAEFFGCPSPEGQQAVFDRLTDSLSSAYLPTQPLRRLLERPETTDEYKIPVSHLRLRYPMNEIRLQARTAIQARPKVLEPETRPVPIPALVSLAAGGNYTSIESPSDTSTKEDGATSDEIAVSPFPFPNDHDHRPTTVPLIAVEDPDTLTSLPNDTRPAASNADHAVDCPVSSDSSILRPRTMPEASGTMDARTGATTVSERGELVEEESGPPPFPIDALRGIVRTFVDQGAASLIVPPEMIALPLLAAAGAVIGNQRLIKLIGDWVVLPIIWTAVVADSGSAKSPAQRLAVNIVSRLQERVELEFDLACEEAKTHGYSPPAREDLFTTDATMEALAPMLKASSGILVVQDELAGFARQFDAYRAGRGADRQKWLSLWSGTTIKVDRRGQLSGPIYVSRPVACLSGSIQPATLGELNRDAIAGDGFVQRLLFAWPKTQTRYLSASTPAIDPVVKDAMFDLFTELRWGRPSSEPVELSLSPSATELFIGWHNVNADRADHALGIVKESYLKLPEQAGKLALILACLADPSATVVSDAIMDDAITLAEYFKVQADLVLPKLGAGPDDLPRQPRQRILKVLADARRPVTTTDIHKALNRSVSGVGKLLADLLAEGKVRVTTSSGNPGRPTQLWEIAT